MAAVNLVHEKKLQHAVLQREAIDDNDQRGYQNGDASSENEEEEKDHEEEKWFNQNCSYIFQHNEEMEVTIQKRTIHMNGPLGLYIFPSPCRIMFKCFSVILNINNQIYIQTDINMIRD